MFYYRLSHQLADLGWVDLRFGDVSQSWSVALPFLSKSHLPKQNWANSGTAKISQSNQGSRADGTLCTWTSKCKFLTQKALKMIPRRKKPKMLKKREIAQAKTFIIVQLKTLPLRAIEGVYKMRRTWQRARTTRENRTIRQRQVNGFISSQLLHGVPSARGHWLA